MSLVWGMILLLILPAGLFTLVYGAIAVAAVPLTILLMFLLPRAWLRDMPAITLFCGSMLLVPVMLMMTLAIGVLATRPFTWEPIEWREIEHARLPGDTWRHMFPVRPTASPSLEE